MSKTNWKVVVTGLVCLTFLEAWALFNGINGTLFTVVVAVIAAAIGVTVPTPKFIKTN